MPDYHIPELSTENLKVPNYIDLVCCRRAGPHDGRAAPGAVLPGHGAARHHRRQAQVSREH